jgi:hypothetical protein
MCHGFALVRHLALRRRVARTGVLLGRIERLAVDHARDSLRLLGQRRLVVLGRRQRCGLVRNGALPQR